MKRTLIFIALAMLMNFSCGGPTASPADQLQTASVQGGKIEATITSLGSLAPVKEKWLGFEIGGSLEEMDIAEGQEVKAGQTLAELDPTELERAVREARAELESAQVELEKAKHPYTQLDLKLAEGAVRDAKVALENAKKNLAIVKNSPDNAERIRTLEYEANWYKNNYWEAQKKFEEGKIDQQKLNWEYSNMLAAQERLEVARGKREIAISEAENRMAMAEDNLKKAQQELARIRSGPDPEEVKLAENRVEKAQLSLERALENLEKATLTAPFTGIVVAIKATPGETVMAGDKIIHLIDLSSMRIEVRVDEYDIGKIEVGQEVSVVPDAFPDKELLGRVKEVSIVPVESEGIATYPVNIDIPHLDPIVKPGMGAEVNVVVAKKEDVLLIPKAAVKEKGEAKVVYILSGDQITPVSVSLGISDGEVTEVVEGLEEGQRVITSGEELIREYLEASERESENFWQTLKRFFMGLLGLGGE